MRLSTAFSLCTLALVLGLVVACSDDDNPASSPSAPADGSPQPGDPAEAVAIFASPEETRSLIEALLSRDDIRLALLAESGRDPASFDGLTIPGELEVVGTSSASTARVNEVFEAAYEEATEGEPDDTARQTYDAVYVAALAAAAANNSEAAAIAAHLPYVANPPGEIVGPGADEFSRALIILGEGRDINYVGVSGLVDLDANGDLSKGATEVWKVINGQIAPLETRDVDLAAEIEAEVPPGALSPADSAPGEPLVLTTSADTDAADLAIAEITEAGGVFGQPIEQLEDGGEPNVVIASSADTAPATDAVVLSLSTTPDPTTADDHLYRLAAPQTLQAAVLANIAREREIGVVCVVHSDDPAGQAMSAAFRTAFEHKDGAVRQEGRLGTAPVADLLADCIGP